MKRASVIAGVIFVGVGLGVVLHGGSKKSDAKPTNEKVVEHTGTTPSTAAPSLGPSVAKTDKVEHANIDGLPEPLEAGYLAVEHAAKGCYRGRPAAKPIRPDGPDETIETIQLSYRQVVNHGTGHIEDLKVIDGKLTDEALQSCIVKVAASATWSSNLPDGEIGTLDQNVSLGDLMRPDYGLPPPERRSPKPTAPPPPELAGPLGKQAEEPEDDHAGVVVPDPALAKQRK